MIVTGAQLLISRFHVRIVRWQAHWYEQWGIASFKFIPPGGVEGILSRLIQYSPLAGIKLNVVLPWVLGYPASIRVGTELKALVRVRNQQPIRTV
jgi:hypothetical protein